MKYTNPKRITPTASRMVAHLREFGPLRAAEVAEVFKKNPLVVTQHLRIAKNCGEIDVTCKGGRWPLWFVHEHAERAAQMEATRVEAARDRKKAMRMEKDKARKAKARADREEAQDKLDTAPFVKRVVSAKTAEKPQALGPASIFHLGAML